MCVWHFSRYGTDFFQWIFHTGSQEFPFIVLSQKAREALTGKQILYIEREQYAPDHHNTATLFQPGEINEASFAPGGAMRVYDVDSGKIRTLIETTEGVVRDPEISFDGQKVLFSMRQHPKDSYHGKSIPDGSGWSEYYTDRCEYFV